MVVVDLRKRAGKEVVGVRKKVKIRPRVLCFVSSEHQTTRVAMKRKPKSRQSKSKADDDRNWNGNGMRNGGILTVEDVLSWATEE